MEKQISQDALAVLSECSVAGNGVAIRGIQLERTLYEEVNAVLMGIGGKWNRKARVHLFEEPEAEIREMLEGCIQTGLAVPLRRGEYFPTPPDTAEKMVHLADIKGGVRILEPSAGEGALIDAIMAICKRGDILSLDAIENDAKRYRKICDKYADQRWFHPYPLNFLDWVPGPIYDRVVMNPPFAFFADIDHVMHAYGLLSQGGKLVSIMSSSVTFRREAKAQTFRELVESCGSIEALPAGSFKCSGTGANTVLVMLNKE